ncbi:hypothetical protein VUR80DRAFT_10010 [Thermomyces stellatus]
MRPVNAERVGVEGAEIPKHMPGAEVRRRGSPLLVQVACSDWPALQTRRPRAQSLEPHRALKRLNSPSRRARQHVCMYVRIFILTRGFNARHASSAGALSTRPFWQGPASRANFSPKRRMYMWVVIMYLGAIFSASIFLWRRFQPAVGYRTVYADSAQAPVSEVARGSPDQNPKSDDVLSFSAPHPERIADCVSSDAAGLARNLCSMIPGNPLCKPGAASPAWTQAGPHIPCLLAPSH